jgi:hypothetical protein
MYTKTTISGIYLHWNYQNHFWFIYIKELFVQKYWQLISTKQLWSVRNIVSSKSRTVQFRVPRCPGQYRNVQDRVPRCPSQYRDVQVPRCLGFVILPHSHPFYFLCDNFYGPCAVRASSLKIELVILDCLTVSSSTCLFGIHFVGNVR